MIVLDFTLSPGWKMDGAQDDLATADEIALRYRLFLGDLIMTLGSSDFSTNWGWVPLVDLTASLRRAAMDIASSPEASVAIDFTENAEKLQLERRRSILHVSATYTQATAEVELPELVEAVHEFVLRLDKTLVNAYPTLLRNPVFGALLGRGAPR
jgi:hypothetical protein